ncbi:MAG TPA: hypothetical protein VI815_02720 [Candidatus Nanoarchaeia archaeon]|nr:hypothetical protein [Candidatus Nanoarchaeia archaeon]
MFDAVKEKLVLSYMLKNPDKEFLLYWSGGQDDDKYIVMSEVIRESKVCWYVKPIHGFFEVRISKHLNKKFLGYIYKGKITQEIELFITRSINIKIEKQQLTEAFQKLRDEINILTLKSINQV